MVKELTIMVIVLIKVGRKRILSFNQKEDHASTLITTSTNFGPDLLHYIALTKVSQKHKGAMVSNQAKGFSVPISTRFGSVARTMSFQLTPDGARYFLVEEVPLSKTILRDVSTQYRALIPNARGSLFFMGREETKRVHECLITHARAFYPEFLIPEEGMSNPYPWVAFPMLGAAMKDSNRRAPIGVNLQVASGLRAFSVQDMTARIFGEAPRQLQAAVAQSLSSDPEIVNIDNLTLASLLRGYLPPNEMVEILRMPLKNLGFFQQIDKQSANNIRLLLRRFNPRRLLRLMLTVDENNYGYMTLSDTANQYADARKHHPDVVMDLSRQFQSFDQLHESVTREYRKLANANQEIHYNDSGVEALEDVVLAAGARLIWPSCTHDLLDWANTMNNCIYAYGKDAATSRCLLLAVLDVEGKMIINIMVRGKQVIQCYGPSNQMITDEPLLAGIFKGLTDAEIINPESNYTNWLQYNRGW